MIKKSDGSIYPCEILIKFLYSERFGHNFIASISPLSSIIPFNSNVKYETDKLNYLIVENESGEIKELSKNLMNCLKVLEIEEMQESNKASFNAKKVFHASFYLRRTPRNGSE